MNEVNENATVNEAGVQGGSFRQRIHLYLDFSVNNPYSIID